MSVTTTQNPVTGSVLQVLADYDLHHSGDPAQPREADNPNQRPQPAANNPDWWPSNYNRIPPHRPINRNLDLEQRPGGVNIIERTFIFTMLNGCGINAVCLQRAEAYKLFVTDVTQNAAQLWRTTGGRLNDKLFYYKIGGEK